MPRPARNAPALDFKILPVVRCGFISASSGHFPLLTYKSNKRARNRQGDDLFWNCFAEIFTLTKLMTRHRCTLSRPRPGPPHRGPGQITEDQSHEQETVESFRRAVRVSDVRRL